MEGMMRNWDGLDWWGSQECSALEKALHEDPPGSYLPDYKNIYDAFHYTPFYCVKVVIIGQDPYPTPGMAHGLAFSIRRSWGGPLPPSLLNIKKELFNDLDLPAIKLEGHDLTSWAKQGVLLWNTVLTVEPNNPGAHEGVGWEKLTTEVIQRIGRERRNVAFVLWGQKAQATFTLAAEDELKDWRDKNGHLVLTSAHPSPRSADRGFLGSRPFSKVNDFLTATQQSPIDWSLG
jgi:uracil-DNA glycosylase